MIHYPGFKIGTFGSLWAGSASFTICPNCSPAIPSGGVAAPLGDLKITRDLQCELCGVTRRRISTSLSHSRLPCCGLSTRTPQRVSETHLPLAWPASKRPCFLRPQASDFVKEPGKIHRRQPSLNPN